MKQNIHAKPLLRKDNQVRRVEYALEHIDSLHMFHNFYNEVHVDEKWFSLFKVKQRVILHPLEERRVQKCTSKRYVPKIMFMAAVARPRYDSHTKTWFDGLIGIWPFITKKEAKRSSYKRKKGTIETVAIGNVTNVEHERMLVDNVIPAIKAKFPSSCKNQPLYIQLDNARPHTVRVDKLIEEQNRTSNDGWNILIKRQPPNSPDMNILDLVSENRFDSFVIAVGFRHL